MHEVDKKVFYKNIILPKSFKWIMKSTEYPRECFTFYRQVLTLSSYDEYSYKEIAP